MKAFQIVPQYVLKFYILNNISLFIDFGNTFKRGAFSSNFTNNQHVLQRRLSQAAQARDTLCRANQTTQLKFPLGMENYNFIIILYNKYTFYF